MPPFHLRLDVQKPAHYKINRILYTKNEYEPSVKVSNWDIAIQSFPFDTDPRCPGNVNEFLSHYKRLGFGNNEPFISETQESLEQIYMKTKPVNPAVQMKHFMNYFSYRDPQNACENGDKGDEPIHECVADYLTTMQDSYTMPSKYEMTRLEFQPAPFLVNRRLKSDNPDTSDCKYYDDDFHSRTTSWAKIKSHRSVSYNPCTYKNSDGSDVEEKRKPKCYTLDF